MAKQTVSTGYSNNNLPYARIGSGPRTLVVFEGLNFKHTQPSGMALKMNSAVFRGLPDTYTLYMIGRKPGLPEGCTMRDIAADYAEMIEKEIEGPVDVAGMSTGGPPAMWLAVDRPDLVRKLVLVSTGYRLSDYGKAAQLEILAAARTGNKRKTAAATAGLLFHGSTEKLMRILFSLMAPMMYEKGDSLSDGIAELAAEDAFNFKDKLKDITVPTLVIGGTEDPLYPLRETAEGIPGSKLILYENAGHTASMKKEFKQDLVQFLDE